MGGMYYLPGRIFLDCLSVKIYNYFFCLERIVLNVADQSRIYWRYFYGFIKMSTLGRRQAVRHRFLVPAFGGSNPPAPAKKNLPLMQG